MSRTPPPAADPDKEDLAPLLAWLTEKACQAANSEAPHAAGMLTWAAQVVGERVDEDAPAPPATDEVAKLVATLEREADAEEKRDRTAWITADELRRCAEILRQRSPQPVWVSECPWERDGWCDKRGRCWLQGKCEGDWRLLDPRKTGIPQLTYVFSYSLPHYAIPIGWQQP
jgi:hypothetical protein